MNKARLVRCMMLSSAAMVLATILLGVVFGDALAADDEGAKLEPHPHANFIALAAAVCVAAGTLGAGYAVGKVGSAALGAASERPEIMGRALLFVALGEGIGILGLVGGVMLIRYLTV